MAAHHDVSGGWRGQAASATRRSVRRDIIVIGGSSGALDSMLTVAGAFDADFSGSIFIVSHIGANHTQLPELLSSAGPLPAKHPENGEAIRSGTVYVAPPDRHMMVDAGHIRLSRGPRQHFTRPAIDPLFRSAALEYGPRVIGVLLSGSGRDGTAGLDAVRRAGGRTIVHDPSSTLYPDMPLAAVELVKVDHIASHEEMPDLLRRLSTETTGVPAPVEETSSEMEERERPIALTCPECGGSLREDSSNGMKQYRCHIGHRLAPEEVLSGQLEAVDHAIEVAIRVLNERVELCRHMAENARSAGRRMGADHWRRLQKDAEGELAVLQRFIKREPILPAPEIA